MVEKALVCRIAMSPCRGRRDLRSVERTAGAIPRPYRTYEAIQAPWLPGSRLPSRGSGDVGSLGRRKRWSRSPAGLHPARGDMGCSSPRIEEGSTEPPGALDRARSTGTVPFTRRSSAHAARRSNSPGSFPLPRRRSEQGHRPRLVRGDAPARGTRRGSTDGMAPWRHLTNGPEFRSCRPGRWLAHRTRRQISCRMETSGAGERGDGCPSSHEVGYRGGVSPPERGPRREPRAEEDSRLAGVPARRSCVAEIGRQPQAQRSSLKPRRSPDSPQDRRGPAATSEKASRGGE